MGKPYTLYICNAFSLSMLDRVVQSGGVLTHQPRTLRPCDDPRSFLNHWAPYAEIVSVVGHADTARLFSRILGVPVEHNRATIKLDRYNKLALIGQYIGPRLPEGAQIEWWTI